MAIEARRNTYGKLSTPWGRNGEGYSVWSLAQSKPPSVRGCWRGQGHMARARVSNQNSARRRQSASGNVTASSNARITT